MNKFKMFLTVIIAVCVMGCSNNPVAPDAELDRGLVGIWNLERIISPLDETLYPHKPVSLTLNSDSTGYFDYTDEKYPDPIAWGMRNDTLIMLTINDIIRFHVLSISERKLKMRHLSNEFLYIFLRKQLQL